MRVRAGGGSPSRTVPCSRHKPLGAHEKPQNITAAATWNCEESKGSVGTSVCTVRAATSVYSPPFLPKRALWKLVAILFYIFFIPFVFSISHMGSQGARCMSVGNETKDPVDLMGEKKKKKIEQKLSWIGKFRNCRNEFFFYPHFPGEKKCARALKRGVYSLEEHALHPQTHILDFHTFIEEKMRFDCAQERLLTRFTHSILFIDCPEIVYDYIISGGC